MIEKKISFGTSGHRGIIGKDITLDHVKAIANAVAFYVYSQKNTLKVALGFDPRKGNSLDLEEGSFSGAICEELIRQGIDVDVFDDFVPTPVVSWYIEKEKLAGGLILTASHNPAEYNGIKFNPANGAPASADITKIIEDKANQYFGQYVDNMGNKKGIIRKVKVENEFAFDMIDKVLKLFGKEKKLVATSKIALDVKHGTAGKYWRAIFANLGMENFSILCEKPLSDFGGIEANPTKLNGLIDLEREAKNIQADFALANDPDADRHIILDEKGMFVKPEELSVVILDYLYHKGVKIGGVASTVASSAIIKSATDKLGIKYFETPVGFKHFAPYLEKGRIEDNVVLAVESSGGFSASFHTMEKCGFLPAVMLFFILKDTGKTLSNLVSDITKKYGLYKFIEEEYHFKPEDKMNLLEYFKNVSIEKIKSGIQENIQEIVKMDGVKIIFDKGWVLMRLSGTEPLARIYAESLDEQTAKSYLALAKKILANVSRD